MKTFLAITTFASLFTGQLYSAAFFGSLWLGTEINDRIDAAERAE